MTDKTKIVYTCGVDWQHEMGETVSTVYNSIEALKEANKCWESCGIVALEVSLKEWIVEQDLSKGMKSFEDYDQKKED